MRRLGLPPLDLAGFRRRLAMARAGILDLCEEWEPTLAIGAELPEDILAPFLLVARAAREGSPCPSDEALAEAYGTSSPARVRRLLAWMEERQIIASRTDLSGRRSIAIPRLGWTTAPARSEEHTSELQSLMRISYAVFCLTKKNNITLKHKTTHNKLST